MKRFCILVLTTLTLFVRAQESQDANFSVYFNVYLDDKKVERDNIKYTISNITSNSTKTQFVSDQFTTFFHFDRIYKLQIGCGGYNTKTLWLSTFCPLKNHDIILNFYLYSDQKDEVLGMLEYKPETKLFEITNNK